jgi:hypothetical protein
MSERDEGYTRSHLPLWVKLSMMYTAVGFLVGPGLWAALLDLDLLSFLMWLLIADVALKIVWRLC